MVPLPDSFGPARQQPDLGMAEPANTVASAAAFTCTDNAVDVGGRTGDRLCRRSSCTRWGRVCLRRFRGPDRGRSLLELVHAALGTESMVAMGADRAVRGVNGSYRGCVFCP